MRCWPTSPPDCPDHRSLCRTYEIDPASLSNSYAPMSTLAARERRSGADRDRIRPVATDETTRTGRHPARPRRMENHDDHSHSPTDSICRNGRIPLSGRSHARCARLRHLCQSEDARRCAGVAAAQSSARARSPSPADAREEQIAGEGGTHRALTMSVFHSVFHMGRGHGEGRARLQALSQTAKRAPRIRGAQDDRVRSCRPTSIQSSRGQSS